MLVVTLHATLLIVVSLTTASAAWIGPLQPSSRTGQSPAIAAQAPPPDTAPASPPPSAEAQAKGASLLSEARKVLGGDDRLKGVKTLQLNGTFRRAAGNNTLEGDVEIFLEPPAKYRRNETTGVAGGPIAERTEVLNGTEVWDRNSGGIGGFGGFGGFRGAGGRGRPGDAAGGQARDGGAGAQPPAVDPERLREAQRRQRQAEVARLLLTLLLTPEGTVAWVGTAESPDGSADVVEVTPPQGAASRVFLDAATHMPLMITTTAGGGRGGRAGAGGAGRGGRRGSGDVPSTGAADAPATAGAGDGAVTPAQPPVDGQGRRGRGPQRPPQALTIETHLSEYKSVSGIKLPHLVTRGVNGQTNEEWVVKNYKLNQTFKGNTFSQ
jgi:hypothetical protein